ncbi:MAG: tRNA (adenosine(37)-N6)-dimethylallyltransferase MiaA [Candidatus Saccharibacteria bacterium]
MITTNNSIIALIGPTASGKTTLAIELAKKHNGEILCADSRTIYMGMDIGTAKPTGVERQGIVHHFLDIITPDHSYSAQQFKFAAEAIIEDIIARGKTPIIVGGTGLYVYALLYDYAFPAGGRSVDRAAMELRELDDLVVELQEKDPELALEIDLQNKRRVIRAIETAGLPRQKAVQLKSNILLMGLRPEMTILDTNITQRTKRMIQIGLVDEVRDLTRKYGTEVEVLRSPGYAEIISFLAQEISLEEAERLIALHTRQLVKRQLTWFKRNQEIQWVGDAEQGLELVDSWLPENLSFK